jgi:uncharacterized protein YndB with AHSA1/START domain
MTAEPLVITTPSDVEVTMSRRFDAPRSLVFEALTTPDLLRRWYGPEGWELVVCDIDLRVGGTWRFLGRTADGREVGQYGTYLEIESPARIVQTERWEDWDPGETLVTTTLTEVGDATDYTTTMRFPSQEVRDIVMRSGLESGARQGYDKLAIVLADILREGRPPREEDAR